MPLSPNMNLPIPVPSQTGGPQYALDEQSCFQQIDSHNHTPGQGSLIPLNALSVNQDLSMGGFSVTNLKSLQLNNQLISPGPSSLYMLGNNLYFSDGTGAFNVQITSGNAVAVSGAVGFSGLPSGTASAAYLSLLGTFRFQSATNTAATLDVGPIKTRNTLASSNAVTINAPNPLPADYSITLPASTPGSNKILQMGATGAIYNTLDVDNSTLQIAGNSIQVANAGITQTQLANNSVGTNQIIDGSVTSSKLSGAIAPVNRTPTVRTEISFPYQTPTYPSYWQLNTGVTTQTNLIYTIPYTPSRTNVNLLTLFSYNGSSGFLYWAGWNPGGPGPQGGYLTTCYMQAIFQNANITTTLLTVAGGSSGVSNCSRIVPITDTAPGNIYLYFTNYGGSGSQTKYSMFTSNFIFNCVELN